MSRKDRHHSSENNETQEPWEQPIYDTEDEVSSRSSQRQQKKGNTLFLSLFLVLLGLCIAIPAGAYFWIRNGSSNASSASSTTTTSSVVESTTSSEVSSTKESSTEPESTTQTESVVASTPQSTTVPEETTPSTTSTYQQETQPTSTVEEATTPSSSAAADGSTVTVQPGDGPKQVAERAGITIDQLFALNGLDPNNYMIYPGQPLKVK